MSSTSPMALALVAGIDIASLDENESDDDDERDEEDSDNEPPHPTPPATARPNFGGDIGAVPLEPQSVTTAPENEVEETKHDLATRSPVNGDTDDHDEGTTGSVDMVTGLSATTDAVTTSASTTADEVEVVTRKYAAATTPETLEGVYILFVKVHIKWMLCRD